MLSIRVSLGCGSSCADFPHIGCLLEARGNTPPGKISSPFLNAVVSGFGKALRQPRLAILGYYQSALLQYEFRGFVGDCERQADRTVDRLMGDTNHSDGSHS